MSSRYFLPNRHMHKHFKNFGLNILVVFFSVAGLAQKKMDPEFHPLTGRKAQTYMGPSEVRHQYADNREMKWVSQANFRCEPIFALIDPHPFDNSNDLVCEAMPFVFDPNQKNETAQLAALKKQECFKLSISKCVLNDKKIWTIKNVDITEASECPSLVKTKSKKDEAQAQCLRQTSESFKAEKKLKADEVERARIAKANTPPLFSQTIFDAGIETQGRKTFGLGYSFSKLKSHDGLGAMYPFAQVAMREKDVESYSAGLRIWIIYFFAMNYHVAYEHVIDGDDRLGLEAGLGFYFFTPYLGYATDFKGSNNVRAGFRIIFSPGIFN